MIVYPDDILYAMVKPEDAAEIVNEHLLKGRPVTRLIYDESVTAEGVDRALNDTSFYSKQHPSRSAQLRRHQSGKHRRVHRP